jgi:hypothetical protein
MFAKIWKTLAIVKHVLRVGHHPGKVEYDELRAFGTRVYFYTWSVLHMCNSFHFAHIMLYHNNFLYIYIEIISTHLAWPSLFLYCHVYFGGLHNIVWDVTIFLEGSSLCCLIMPEITWKTTDAKYGYDCVRYMVQQQPYKCTMWNCYLQLVSWWAPRLWFPWKPLFKFVSGIVKSRYHGCSLVRLREPAAFDLAEGEHKHLSVWEYLLLSLTC